MTKKWLIIVAMTLASVYLATAVFAEEAGNKRKGKYLYRKVYKACNERGEVESPKPSLNPDAKTQGEWKDIFENELFTEFGCTEEWEALSDQALLDIFTYLHDHAADSPTPLKCK
ncbi:MAG: cytochrome c family protein [Desulfobacteraceae bacterium]|nr:cytochrome c family protein [Desulfobacteraceae bacterium]